MNQPYVMLRVFGTYHLLTTTGADAFLQNSQLTDHLGHVFLGPRLTQPIPLIGISSVP